MSNPAQQQQSSFSNEAQEYNRNLLNQLSLASYPLEPWRKNRGVPENIRQAQDIYKAQSRKDREKVIKDITLRIKKEMKQSGLSEKIDDLAAKFNEGKEGQQKIMAFIEQYRDALGKDVTSGDLGIQYSDKKLIDNQIYDIENDLFFQKFNFTPSGENLEKIAKQFGLTSLSKSKLKDLMLLDSWQTVLAPMVMELLNKHGKVGIDYLWDKFMNKVQGIFPGKDWGGSIIDQGSNPLTDMYKVAKVPGLTSEGTGQADTVNIQNRVPHASFIDFSYVACQLCPEYYTGKIPASSWQQTNTIQSSIEFEMISTAAGTAVMVINPWAAGVASSDASIGDAFATGNPTGFVAATGVLTDPQFYDGPLVGNTNIDRYRVVGFSIQLIPTLSSNTASGSYSLGQYTDYSVTGAQSLATICKNVSMTACGSYVTGNSNTTYRQAMFPGENVKSATFCTASGTFSGVNNLVIRAEGVPASTTIAKVVCNYVYEILPIPDQKQYVPAQVNGSSDMTLELIINLASNSGLYMQQLPDIQAILVQMAQRKDWTYNEAYSFIIAQSKGK